MHIMDAIRNRRSVRAYSSRPISDEVMNRMRQALRYAPSACNIQPWHFILVTDPDLRRQVAQASKDQMWMADAPVIVAACGYPHRAYQAMGGYGNSTDIDVAIALDHLTLAAVAEGLGTCWIGAFDPEAARQVLGLPDDVEPIAFTPLGYPADQPKPKKRKPLSELVRYERW